MSVYLHIYDYVYIYIYVYLHTLIHIRMLLYSAYVYGIVNMLIVRVALVKLLSCLYVIVSLLVS